MFFFCFVAVVSLKCNVLINRLEAYLLTVVTVNSEYYLKENFDNIIVFFAVANSNT